MRPLPRRTWCGSTAVLDGAGAAEPPYRGHYKTTTVTAALRTGNLVATTLFEGATNGERFPGYVTETLIPVPKRGDTVILDNLNVHKVAGVREAIKLAGARLLDLPAYSSDFNPIEQVFANC